jgi:hypothetical protein
VERDDEITHRVAAADDVTGLHGRPAHILGKECTKVTAAQQRVEVLAE